MIFHSHENNPVSNSLTLSLAPYQRHHSRARLISLPYRDENFDNRVGRKKWKSKKMKKFCKFSFLNQFLFYEIRGARQHSNPRLARFREKTKLNLRSPTDAPIRCGMCRELPWSNRRQPNATIAQKHCWTLRCFLEVNLENHSERCLRTRLFFANGKSKQFCFRQFSRRHCFDDMNRVWY